MCSTASAPDLDYAVPSSKRISMIALVVCILICVSFIAFWFATFDSWWLLGFDSSKSRITNINFSVDASNGRIACGEYINSDVSWPSAHGLTVTPTWTSGKLGALAVGPWCLAYFHKKFGEDNNTFVQVGPCRLQCTRDPAGMEGLLKFPIWALVVASGIPIIIFCIRRLAWLLARRKRKLEDG